MDIEVVAIGSEILSGYTINSNASFISRKLFDMGIPTAHHTVVSDDPEEIKAVFKNALMRSRFVIATGGLGPTCDDMTRSVAAELFHSPLEYSPEIAEKLIARYGDLLVSVEDQATVPVKAQIIENPLGTASGFVFNEGESTLFLLPGVPHEMKKMFTESVLPYISERYPTAGRIQRRWMYFFHLFESQVDPILRGIKERNPVLDFGIYPSMGNLSVSISAPEEVDGGVLEKAFEELLLHFGDHYFESESGTIEEAVHNIFVDHGVTLSLAESCTGGALASRLTARAGASDYFLGSLVTYSNELKQSLLNVSAESLKLHGAVSREVVEEMVMGLLERTGSDYAAAVTGIAGPAGGSVEKPVGTVWAAIAKKGEKPRSWLMQGPGFSRGMVIDFSVNIILGNLFKAVKRGER